MTHSLLSYASYGDRDAFTRHVTRESQVDRIRHTQSLRLFSLASASAQCKSERSGRFEQHSSQHTRTHLPDLRRWEFIPEVSRIAGEIEFSVLLSARGSSHQDFWSGTVLSSPIRRLKPDSCMPKLIVRLPHAEELTRALMYSYNTRTLWAVLADIGRWLRYTII